jgi:predicted RNA-binding Zn ribbon-like protein|tara:strand:+ start:12398 stop:12739 length:342 start_codon:yes stop_codon:yes gene_type:complete
MVRKAKKTTPPAEVEETRSETLKAAEAKLDIDQVRAQIREEEADKFRAESAERAAREKERQEALDAKRADYVRVTCVVDKCHTSAGRLRTGQTKSIHKDEAALLESAGLVTTE